MIIDMDHLSLESWTGSGTSKGLEALAKGAGNYPLIAGHTSALGVQNSSGVQSERQLNDEQLNYVHQSGGLVSIGVNQGAASGINFYPSQIDGTFVPNDCDQSAKSFAQNYLYIRDKEWDTPVIAIASDQSLNPLIGPRFGPGACAGNTGLAAKQSENPGVSYSGPSGRFLAIAGPGPNPPLIPLWVKEVDDSLNQTRIWNFNTDGLAHLGLYPELMQELTNLKGFELTELFSSAEGYIEMWEAAENASKNLSPPSITDGSGSGGSCPQGQILMLCGTPVANVCVEKGATCPGPPFVCPPGSALKNCGVRGTICALNAECP
jgi:hypothetical protein